MSEEITDADGRVLQVRELSIRDRMKLLRKMGAAADVSVWISQVALAACVTAIDGVPVMMPETPDAAEFLVDKVGTEGANAVAAWYVARRDAKEVDKERLKNSSALPTS